DKIAARLQRLDLFLLLSSERDTNTRQREQALRRVVQRLAQLDRRARRVLAERHAHVEQRRRRLIEDVVALTRSVADFREREEQVLGLRDRVVLNAAHVRQRPRQFLDLFGADVRHALRALDDSTGLRRDLASLVSRLHRLLAEVENLLRRERRGERASRDLRDVLHLTLDAALGLAREVLRLGLDLDERVTDDRRHYSGLRSGRFMFGSRGGAGGSAVILASHSASVMPHRLRLAISGLAKCSL